MWPEGSKIQHDKGCSALRRDAVSHGLLRAVWARGLGEIGVAFPPYDPRFKGWHRRKIVAHTLATPPGAGGGYVHLDAMLIARSTSASHYAATTGVAAELFKLP